MQVTPDTALNDVFCFTCRYQTFHKDQSLRNSYSLHNNDVPEGPLVSVGGAGPGGEGGRG